MRLLIFAVLALGGCSSQIPFVLDCNGKGQITGTGHGNMGAGLTGNETNAFTLTADCGGDGSKGFHFQRTNKTP